MEIRKGQINLLIMVSFVILIIFLFYYMTETSERKTELKKKGDITARLAKLATETRNKIENLLVETIYQSVDEMAEHGGYTIENIPSPVYLTVPVWFYQGHIVNIPKVSLMEEMLASEISSRLDAALTTKEFVSDSDIIFFPSEVEVELKNETVNVVAIIPYEISYKDVKTKNMLKFTKTINLRLKYLRDLAESYVKNYDTVRMIESSFFNSIKNDDRIWEPPGRPMYSIACDKPPYKTKHELLPAIRENAQIAVAREQKRARKLFSTEKFLELNFAMNPLDISFSFRANNMGRGFETSRIYLNPIRTPPFSSESNICQSFYSVVYNVEIPVRISFTDLRPVEKVKYSLDSAGITGFLEFKFAIIPFLSHKPDGRTDIFAKNNSLKIPPVTESICNGRCSINLKIKNSAQGRLMLDSCVYNYKNNFFKKDNIACGLRTLIIKSEISSLADYVENIRISGRYTRDIYLPEYASVSGEVLLNNTIYCRKTGKVITKKPKKIYYIEGNPPAYIEIFFHPLISGLPMRKTIVDENGRYTIHKIVPGRYMLFALPNKDSKGIAIFKVLPEGRVVELKSGQNNIDIIMLANRVIKLNNKYLRVSHIEEC